MIHIQTVPEKGGLHIYWQLDEPIEGKALLDLEFNRTAIGVSWHDEYVAVVVGEKQIEHLRKTDRYWVVLDESKETIPQKLFENLVDLKDRYRTSVVYCANNPAMMVESLRQTEGISFYREERYPVADEKWAHFVDFDHRAGIRQYPPPDEGTLHRDIERWLSTTPIHPETDKEIVDNAGEPLFKLQLPNDFPTQITQTGLQTANYAPCEAVWFALHGMELSVYMRTDNSKKDIWQHKPGRGGY